MGQTVGTRQIDNQIPPRENFVRIASVTVANLVVDVQEFADEYIRLVNDGANAVYILVGVANTVVAAPAAVAGATTCIPLAPTALGYPSVLSFRLRRGTDNFMAVITSAGVSVLRYYPVSERPGFGFGNFP